VSTLLDAEGITKALQKLATDIARDVPKDTPLGIIGIRRRGDTLASRLIDILSAAGIGEIAHGALDITLYRDDLAELGPAAVLRETDIPFDISDRFIVLVDDVLYTGRSIRAALDALADHGRPKAIRLAVLVDRPGRELPIQADFVGIRLERSSRQVNVFLKEFDGQERVEIQ
jgi:pyrimidine operon attenuation protein / uracil phosphoribosyltransferase